MAELEAAQIGALREYVDTRIEMILARIEADDTRYQTQFASAKEAVALALQAQEKAMAAAFLASEKAIVKAEDAQRDYNVRSNEFRGQLDDQAKTLMPRAETLTLFRAIEDRITSLHEARDVRMDVQRVANERMFDRIMEDIKSLRESRSEGTGRGAGYQIAWGVAVAIASITIAVLSRWIP